jgi:hypothetical protein
MKNFTKYLNIAAELIFTLAAGMYVISSFIEKDPTKSFQFMVLGGISFILAKLMEITNKSD